MITKAYIINTFIKTYLFSLLFFFCLTGLFANSYTTEEVQSLKDSIYTWKTEIETQGNIYEGIKMNAEVSLPVGIKKRIGNQEYLIIIDKIILNEEGLFFDASMVLTLLGTDKELFFRGTNIPLGVEGFGSGFARMFLVTNEQIPENNLVTLEILGENKKTYVDFDCDGFKTLSLDGRYTFSKEMLVYDNNGSPDDSREVTARFTAQTQDFTNLLTTITMDPFQLKGLVGVSFNIQEASLDKSELSNPSTLSFPSDYTRDIGIDGIEAIWQGIHIKKAQVSLPDKFSLSGGTRRSIAVTDMLIDNQGFTAQFGTSELFALGEEKMESWKFSVDTISFDIYMNSLRSAGFGGMLEVPLFPDFPLDYVASIDLDDNYYFAVETRKEVEVPLLLAHMELYENSSISVEVENGRFKTRANLHGNISIAPAKNGSIDAALAGIEFENMQVANHKPYLKMGTFGLTGRATQKVANTLASFPVSIENVRGIDRGNLSGLAFALRVNFMGQTDKGFGGKTDLSILGNTAKKRWGFEKVELNEVRVDANLGPITFKGLVQIYREDPTYGKGFRGSVLMKVTPGIEVDATAQFGRVDGFRYWYVDGSLFMSNGIPVAPPFSIFGFGGGASYRMAKKNQSNAVAKSVGIDPTAELVPGYSRSGVSYVPDKDIGLGVRAKVILGLTRPEVFNGDATFEIIFNRSGGVNYISFEGNARFLSQLSEDGAVGTPPIYANLYISYAVPEKTLHGVLKTYVKVAGGLIQGIGDGGSAGTAVIHFDPDDWYIYIGTPDSRIGLKLMWMLEIGAYFMVGSTLPGFPDPPSEVSEILGGMDLSLMRNENQLSQGGGLAFGASLKFDTGDITFLMFYGRIKAGVGFDVMLKNYGKSAQCAGRSGAIGINGWYAAGQAYAYLQGEVGIKVKLKFGAVKVNKKIKIVEVGAAAILQAKLPNPTFFRGAIGGYFSVLGGLVSGRVNFKFQFGNECRIEGIASPLETIKVISQTTPSDKSKEVSVFAAPQVILSMPVLKPFEMYDMQDMLRHYRMNLSAFNLQDEEGNVYEGKLEYNFEKDVIAFIPFEILPGQRKMNMVVKVAFEEWINNQWVQVVEEGKLVEEVKELSFVTGESPDHIPARNVSYSYPVMNQMHFHPHEVRTGYIQLKQGQAYLFDKSVWKQRVKFTNTAQDYSTELPLAYDVSKRLVYFDIPQDMPTDQVFNIELLSVPLSSMGAIDQNISTTNVRLGDSEDLKDITTKQKSVGEQGIDNLQQKSLYSYHFKSSQYLSFREKMQSFSVGDGARFPMAIGVHKIGARLSGDEFFDQYELLGDKLNHTQALVQLRALQQNPWIQGQLIPKVYQPYPLDGIGLTWRNTDTLGIVPYKAVKLRQYPNNESLNPADPSSGPLRSSAGSSSIEYHLSAVSYYDMYYQKMAAASKLALHEHPHPDLFDYIMRKHPSIPTGRYAIEMNYVLPGIQKVSSTYIFTIDFD